MERNRKFERFHTRYFVKSPVIFCAFFFSFVAIFVYLTLSVSLDVRQTFAAALSGSEVSVGAGYEVVPLNDDIYLYTNRNSKVVAANIAGREFSGGQTLFELEEEPQGLAGDVVVEINVGKQSLFSRIFAKAGKGR